MKTIYIISIILILIILFLYTKNKEHLTGDEAIQNIAKVYADASGTVSFNNVTAGGTIDIINPNKTTEGTAKKWRFENSYYAPGTGENALKIWQFDGKTGSATSNFSFEDRGVLIAKNIFAPGFIHANSSLYGKEITANKIYTTDLSANKIYTTDISANNITISGSTNIDGPVNMNRGFKGSFMSDDSAYRLVMQNDGNLVIYRMVDNKPIWDSK